MKVEFQITKENYIEFYKTQLNERFQKRIPIIVIALLFFIISFNNEQFNWLYTIAAIIGYFLLIYFLFYNLPIIVFNRKFKSLVATEPGYYEKKKWAIEESGLRIESPSKNTLWKWESFKLVRSSEKYINITLVDKRFLLLPRSGFESDAEATNFLGLIQSKIAKSQGIANLTFDPSHNFIIKPKPPYLLGLVCLIPLIGAFVGLALILYGVFKYKNRWLMLIGISGIIVSAGTFFALKDLPKHFSKFNTGLVELDKMTLNVLVKDIEFYKIEHGYYPDSLQQLNNKNQLINTFDLLSSDAKSTVFNYRIIGDKYTVFSSGIDQIAGTKDDIYPTLHVDSSKIGLIIPNK